MYDFKITATEISDYLADMAEMSAPYFPTDEEMEEMYEDAQARGWAE